MRNIKNIKKIKKTKGVHTIRMQFTIIFSILLAGTCLTCWFVNDTFLERYYVRMKQQALKDAYSSINEAVTDGNTTSDEFKINLQKICGKYNINVLVLDAESNTIVSSMNDPSMLSRQLLDNVFNDKNHTERQPIEETDDYTMHITNDLMTKTEYIEMWGLLDNGNVFLIRSALESIKDSVAISNRFLAYIGIGTVILGIIIIWLVTKKITDPVKELTEISERMTHLDFEARYRGNNKNEIELLGENINNLSSTLERTISELKSANNELQRDIEKKNKIDEMRKEFLSNVSHELKTPIALIQGYAEGLQEGINTDDDSREFYCEVIIDEAAKMNTMVKKLLTLNQLEFGKDVVTMERFDIQALIANYLQSAEILTKQKEVQLRFVNTQIPIFVWADEFKTEEVFANYFSNAMNHVNGEKIIEVKLLELDGHVRISVFNTGNPIPEESLPHLFEKFYKVDKARTREYGGSGVGLSIVEAIMDSMNQKFGVQNYENGVEFWFELETQTIETQTIEKE